MANTHKEQSDPDFYNFLVDNYPQHASRVIRANINAWLLRLTYPMMGLIFTVVPLGGIAFMVKFAEVHFRDKLNGVLNPDLMTTALGALYLLAAIGGGFGFIVGLFSGINSARELLFKGEELENRIRSEYYLRLLTANQSKDSLPIYSNNPPLPRRPSRSSTFADDSGPKADFEEIDPRV